MNGVFYLTLVHTLFPLLRLLFPTPTSLRLPLFYSFLRSEFRPLSFGKPQALLLGPRIFFHPSPDPSAHAFPYLP